MWMEKSLTFAPTDKKPSSFINCIYQTYKKILDNFFIGMIYFVAQKNNGKSNKLKTTK